jgi:copper chaperone
MTKMHTFTVPDMTCSHCVATVERAAKSVDATATVKIDLAALVVSIESRRPSADFASAIARAGYTPQLRG